MLHTPVRRYPSDEARSVERQFPEYNVVGVFADLSSAREAIDALSRGRQEADSIPLTALSADKAASDFDARIGEGPAAQYVGRSVLTGATYGAGVGAVGGFIVALF